MQKMTNNYKNNEGKDKREPRTYVDYDIFKGKVRLIQDGSAPTVIDRDEAISIAKAEGKNLVQIAYSKNDFPHAVCKIMDYGKFKYEQQKKEKAAKKAARAATADIKEMCFSIRIDDGDFNTKVSHIKEFLSDKKTKVKVIVKLSRREMNLVDMAKDLMRKILANFDGIAELDSSPTFSNGIICCIIRPTK